MKDEKMEKRFKAIWARIEAMSDIADRRNRDQKNGHILLCGRTTALEAEEEIRFDGLDIDVVEGIFESGHERGVRDEKERLRREEVSTGKAEGLNPPTGGTSAQGSSYHEGYDQGRLECGVDMIWEINKAIERVHEAERAERSKRCH